MLAAMQMAATTMNHRSVLCVQQVQAEALVKDVLRQSVNGFRSCRRKK